MPTRTRLAAAAKELRHARTSSLPMEIAERIQHTIVRIEEMLSLPPADATSADAVLDQAKQLLAECDAWSGKGS